MAGVDYITGQELVFSCAYLLPVALTAWWCRRRTMVVVAVLSGITALLVDKFDGYGYSHPGIEYWNAFTCFLISVITGSVLARLKDALAEREEKNSQLLAALRELETSTAEIRKLQAGLQTVCAFTKKMKVADEWISAEEFLTKHLHIKLSHGISPEAFTRLIGETHQEDRSQDRLAS